MIEIRVNNKWCKGCELCVHFCPKSVFDVDPDGHPIVAREGDCINCKLCELHCPDFAIEVTENDREAACSGQRSHR